MRLFDGLARLRRRDGGQGRFDLLVPAGLILALGAAAIAGLVFIASQSQNRVALEHEMRLVRSALQAELKSLSSTAASYSWWGEAVDRTFVAWDQAWVWSAFGVALPETEDLTSVFILDDSDRTLLAAVGREKRREDALAHVGPAATRLAAAARRAPPDQSVPASAIVDIGGVPHFAVASAFTHYNPEIRPPTRGVLLVTRAIDRGLLEAISGRFGLPDLHWLRPGEGAAAALPVQSPDGGAAGTLGWVPHRPGSDLARFLLTGVFLVALPVLLLVGRVVAVWDRAQRRMREQDRQIAAILDGAADAILVFGADGAILRANAAAGRLLGRAEAELVGRSLDRDAGLRPVAAGEVRPALASLAERPGEAPPLFTVRGADGTDLTLEAAVSVVEAAGGRLFTAVLRDVSARERTERTLRQAVEAAEAASRAKSAFLASMSHELRTPLNAILGFSELIQKPEPWAQERAAEFAGDIHRSGEHLLDLINGLLDMARIEAGRMELRESVFAIPDLVAEVARVFQASGQAQGLAIEATVEEALPRLHADRRALRQMLLNLVGNAVKFTPAGGRVALSARRGGGWLALAVADDGIGIAEEKIPQLAQPFTQIANVLTRTHEGTGMGLYVTRSLAELHGGRMEIRSRLGEGTTVTLLLPATRLVEERPAREDADETDVKAS